MPTTMAGGDVIGSRSKSTPGSTPQFRVFDAGYEDRLEVRDPAKTIVRVASEEGCDLIVLGTEHLGTFQNWLLKVMRVSVG